MRALVAPGAMYAHAAKAALGEKGFLGRKTWKVHQNALGVPERRTKPGFVLVQPRGQTWCTLITYTVTEDYLGAGKYQKAAGVQFGSARFQKCK